MKPYADSNFFTRLYLSLPESNLAEAWLEKARREESPLPTTWLLRLEVLNAFEQQVFVSRLQGQPKITFEQAGAAQANFREDMARSRFTRNARLLDHDLSEKFEALSLRHTARHGFRTYDILHVASALLLGCDTFWSFDMKACKLAALEGLRLAKK